MCKTLFLLETGTVKINVLKREAREKKGGGKLIEERRKKQKAERIGMVRNRKKNRQIN